jgi:hypothetical protein
MKSIIKFMSFTLAKVITYLLHEGNNIANKTADNGKIYDFSKILSLYSAVIYPSKTNGENHLTINNPWTGGLNIQEMM